MRACVLNLVIFTDSEKGLEQATQIVARLTWSYPCRAIVLVAYPDRPPESLKALISAHCQLPDPKGNKACCEQITVEGSAQATEELASMVLPLLVPDLPVVMWWPGDPPLEGPLFERIMHTSDRLIVDSRRFQNPGSSFKRLAQLSEMSYKNVAFNDLNWSRLTPWRRIIAQSFSWITTSACWKSSFKVMVKEAVRSSSAKEAFSRSEEVPPASSTRLLCP